jgi:hypothetical protein
MDQVSTGIFVYTSSLSNLVVNDCTISNYEDGQGQAGVWVQPAASSRANFTINRTVIGNTLAGGSIGTKGVFADGSQGGVPVGVVSNSFISNNPQAGIYVTGGAGASVTVDNSSVVSNGIGVAADGSIASVTVSLDRARVTGNGTGVVSSNGAAVILNNSTIQTNNTGLSTSSGGAIFSYGNNAINGNQPNGSAAPTVIGLH